MVLLNQGEVDNLFFILLKAVFASVIPELFQIIGNRPKYAGSYNVEKGKR